MAETFQYGTQTLDCAANPGERATEIPIARDWLAHLGAERRRTLIEIGAVTPYWTRDGRTIELDWWTKPCAVRLPWSIIDPTDPYEWCERIDLLDPEHIGRLDGADVLTISTIEHAATGEYGPADATYSPRLLQAIVDRARSYLITWPLGHCRWLDAYLVEHAAELPGLYLYERTTADGGWRRVDPLRFDFAYDSPWPYGNGVVFLERRCIMED